VSSEEEWIRSWCIASVRVRVRDIGEKVAGDLYLRLGVTIATAFHILYALIIIIFITSNDYPSVKVAVVIE